MWALVRVSHRVKVHRPDVEEVRSAEVSPVRTSTGEKVIFREREETDGNLGTVVGSLQPTERTIRSCPICRKQKG